MAKKRDNYFTKLKGGRRKKLQEFYSPKIVKLTEDLWDETDKWISKRYNAPKDTMVKLKKIVGECFIKSFNDSFMAAIILIQKEEKERVRNQMKNN